VSVLTDEGVKLQTFESRQATFRTHERFDRFLSNELSLGEFEGLDRVQMDWSLRSAWELAESGDLEAAHRVLLALAVLDHRNPVGLTLLAGVTERLGEPEPALGFYSRALALAPQLLAALVGRGELLLELGRLEEAVSDLIAAVQLDPQDQSPVAARARLLLQGVLRAAGLRLGDPDLVEDTPAEEDV